MRATGGGKKKRAGRVREREVERGAQGRGDKSRWGYTSGGPWRMGLTQRRFRRPWRRGNQAGMWGKIIDWIFVWLSKPTPVDQAVEVKANDLRRARPRVLVTSADPSTHTPPPQPPSVAPRRLRLPPPLCPLCPEQQGRPPRHPHSTPSPTAAPGRAAAAAAAVAVGGRQWRHGPPPRRRGTLLLPAPFPMGGRHCRARFGRRPPVAPACGNGCAAAAVAVATAARGGRRRGGAPATSIACRAWVQGCFFFFFLCFAS